MSDDAKRRSEVAARRAALLFERQQQSERRVTDEEKRHSDMLAKTTRLREQRLARDAEVRNESERRSRRDRVRDQRRWPQSDVAAFLLDASIRVGN
jgi:hypothetical protein